MQKCHWKKGDTCNRNSCNGLQKKLFRLRERANKLFYEEGKSKRSISRKLKVSFNFVLKWTKEKGMNFGADKRGWKKHRTRKWDDLTGKRIVEIYSSLEARGSFFMGATAVELEWKRRYEIAPPPIRTIGWIMKEMRLTRPNKKPVVKGATRYLCYPEHSIHHYPGGRVLEVDFVGKKFMAGRTAPLHFAACSFKYAPKLRHYQRIRGETADELTKVLKAFFLKFERPAVVKMDNGFAMCGSAPQPHVLSKLQLWLLEQGIYPMYAVPRRPFSQASIEGNNSVFGRKFWNRFVFDHTEQMDQKLEEFNQASIQYYSYAPPVNPQRKKFIPRIFYLRQVREDESKKAFIEVANDKVRIPISYINYFVFVEWNLKTEELTIFLEKEKKLRKIKSINFKINPKSKLKLNRTDNIL